MCASRDVELCSFDLSFFRYVTIVPSLLRIHLRQRVCIMYEVILSCLTFIQSKDVKTYKELFYNHTSLIR